MSTLSTTTNVGSSSSLSERYAAALASVETSPATAVSLWTDLQHDVAQAGLLSVETDAMEDICTSTLPLLLIEHHLALALNRLPTPPPSNQQQHGRGTAESMTARRDHLLRACDLWDSFLGKLQALEQLNATEKLEYLALRESSDQFHSHIHGNNNNNSDNFVDNRMASSSSSSTASAAATTLKLMQPVVDRDAKIARFRRQQQAQQEQERLESLKRRRGRIGIPPEEEMDGHDWEGLQRTLALTAIQVATATCIEEWTSVLRELPMISMMEQQQHQTNERRDDRYRNNSHGSEMPPPMKVTHITQDGTTGELLFRRQEIRSNVVKSAWSQPTMSLEEFADREVADALERESRQKASEVHQKTQPRRYDQLVKDGMEDNADLVEASAVLDRRWDQFKEENRRGSGNRRGNVGDRNF